MSSITQLYVGWNQDLNPELLKSIPHIPSIKLQPLLADLITDSWGHKDQRQKVTCWDAW